MALIRSKLHLSFPILRPISSSFCTLIENSQIPNTGDDINNLIEQETHQISTKISPVESQIVERFHSLIKDHHRKNPNFDQTLKPSLNPNFTIPSLSSSFSKVVEAESISEPVVASVIEKCRSVRHGIPFVEALAFYNWAAGSNVGCFKEGVVELIDLIGKVEEFDVAWGLIDEMKQRKFKVPVEVFTSLIRRYVRAGMVAEAVHAFNRMEDYGCKADKAVFTAVIYILAKKKKAADAQSFFDSLKERFELDVVIYTSLVNGWCRVGEISKAEGVFCEMKEAGIEPNVYTYSTVIDALCRHGQITRAHDVFAEMIEKGCSPNAVTFNNLMRVHAKRGKTERVLQVFNQMKRLGCRPDVISYNFLIDCHCKDGNRDEALKLINQMVNKGCAPNVHSFYPIFNCISRSKDVNSAHRLFTKTKELKVELNTPTYNLLMRMFLESKSTDMVLKLKKEMDELQVEPNINTYKVLISMFCAMGHWSNAYKYMKEMIEEKCLRPSQNLYDTLLKQLRDAGQLKKHEELVEMMVGKGFAARAI